MYLYADVLLIWIQYYMAQEENQEPMRGVYRGFGVVVMIDNHKAVAEERRRKKYEGQGLPPLRDTHRTSCCKHRLVVNP